MHFSIKKAYQKLLGENVKVDWRRMVCNNKATQRSIFILWLSLLNRLSIATRMHQWDNNISPLCRVCGQLPETIQHLFFSCGYSQEIWRCILSYISWQAKGDAQAELERAVQKARSKKVKDRLFVMLYTESLYAIWLQRNNQVFNHNLVSPNKVVKDIIYKVAYRCSTHDRKYLIK